MFIEKKKGGISFIYNICNTYFKFFTKQIQKYYNVYSFLSNKFGNIIMFLLIFCLGQVFYSIPYEINLTKFTEYRLFYATNCYITFYAIVINLSYSLTLGYYISYLNQICTFTNSQFLHSETSITKPNDNSIPIHPQHTKLFRSVITDNSITESRFRSENIEPRKKNNNHLMKRRQFERSKKTQKSNLPNRDNCNN